MEQSLRDVVRRVSQLENGKGPVDQPNALPPPHFPGYQHYSTPRPQYSSPSLTPYYLSQQNQHSREYNYQYQPIQASCLPKQKETSDLLDLSDHSEEDDPPPLPEPVLPTSNAYSMPPYPILPYQPAQYLQPKQLVHAYEEDSVSPNSQVSKCFPILGKTKKGQQVSLSSMEINKENLCSHDIVIKKNIHLHKEAHVEKLAVKLAKECFFGEDILKKCTVMGCRNIPALPLKELNDLKQVIFKLFPSFWQNPAGFETEIWSQCVNSIGQLCKRLRSS